MSARIIGHTIAVLLFASAGTGLGYGIFRLSPMVYGHDALAVVSWMLGLAIAKDIWNEGIDWIVGRRPSK